MRELMLALLGLALVACGDTSEVRDDSEQDSGAQADGSAPGTDGGIVGDARVHGDTGVDAAGGTGGTGGEGGSGGDLLDAGNPRPDARVEQPDPDTGVEPDAAQPEPDAAPESDATTNPDRQVCVMVRAECLLWGSASVGVNQANEPVAPFVARPNGRLCFDPITESVLVNVQTDRNDDAGGRMWGLSVTQQDAEGRWCAPLGSPHLRVETSCFLEGHAPADFGFVARCGTSRTMNWFRPADNLPD